MSGLRLANFQVTVPCVKRRSGANRGTDESGQCEDQQIGSQLGLNSRDFSGRGPDACAGSQGWVERPDLLFFRPRPGQLKVATLPAEWIEHFAEALRVLAELVDDPFRFVARSRYRLFSVRGIDSRGRQLGLHRSLH
jgi:hypothetical protein